MRVSEALVDALVAEDVDTVFGLVGGGVEELVGRVVERGLRYVQARHEQGAVGMADGYHRATGRLGVAVVSHGAGLSNAGTHMIVARKARSRLLVVTSDSADDELFSPHRFEQEPFLRATIGQLVTIRTPELVKRDVGRVFSYLQRGAGPIACNLVGRVASLEVPDPWDYRPAAPLPVVAADPLRVAEVADLLRSAERPLLLAGAGAVRAGARGALLTLSERCGAALAESLPARGLFRGCPRSLGVSGGFGDPAAQDLLAEADVVVAFGARISRYTSSWGAQFGKAAVACVDVRDDVEYELTAPSLRVCGDARLVAEALVDLFGAEPSRACWIGDGAIGTAGGQIAEPPTGVRTGSPTSTGTLAPRPGEAIGGAGRRAVDLPAAVERLGTVLPAERLLVADGGDVIAVAATRFQVADPSEQIIPWEFWSIGVGVSVALGASIGRPDRLTTLIIGDGALMLGLADLETAVRERPRLLVVVADNGGYGAERPMLRSLGLPTHGCEFANPNLAEVARSLGYAAYSAEDDDELERLLPDLVRTVSSADRPCLLRLAIDPAAPTPEMDRAYHGYRPT